MWKVHTFDTAIRLCGTGQVVQVDRISGRIHGSVAQCSESICVRVKEERQMSTSSPTKSLILVWWRPGKTDETDADW